MTCVRQLAFSFTEQVGADAPEVVPAQTNADARAWLARPLDWPSLRLAIYGPEGCGKTHLLRAFAAPDDVTLLSGKHPHHLVDLPTEGALAVDDADHALDPEPLLHLINAAAERRLPLLLAARTAPSRWPYTLPDLVSRLRATTAVELGLPDDALLRALLARLLAQRQLVVDPAVQDYLLARLPRHGAALREAAACLDRLSLAAGRSVTRALAAEALRLLGAEDPEPDPPPSQDGPSLV